MLIIFSNEGPFSHLFDSSDSPIEPNFIQLCLAIRITFVLKKKEEISSFSDDREKSLTRLFITCDQVIGLRLDPHYGKRAESLITVP